METKAIQAYEEKGGKLLINARAIMIVDQMTRELATEFTTDVRRVIRNIEEEFKPDIEQAHQLHKSLLDRMNRLIAPFKQARTIVDEEIKRDWLEQESIRKENARQTFLKMERERQAQEVELARQAEQHIADGEFDKAEELCDSQIIVNPVVPVPSVQHTTKTETGSATVKSDIDVVVQDKLTVLRAVIDDKLPETIIQIDLGAVKRYAKASGHRYLPGFIITETAIVSGRTR